ncbi:hypothetical protein BGHDH14_bghG003577000001001 [Blumeria hordei DH14]|uniref:Serine-rich protein n=1 Tax=Blumeria graminis f. sp. hordei (strain DH14) TaxID=546991 RepID=N1JAY0_BLUG1|nr:hypothetical protein BGHDH14_bghG003577000001001 [Blumeria hordei DH14]
MEERNSVQFQTSNQVLATGRTNRSVRKPLHERSGCESNANVLAAIRLVPKTPPKLLGHGNADNAAHYHARPPLPTRTIHNLSPNKGKIGDDLTRDAQPLSEFSLLTQKPKIVGHRLPNTVQALPRNPLTPLSTPSQNYAETSPNRSPSSKPSSRKRQLRIHEDSKTFSLLLPENEAPDIGPKITPDECANSTLPPSRIISLKPSSERTNLPAHAEGIVTEFSKPGSLTPNDSSSCLTQAGTNNNDLVATPTSNTPKLPHPIDSINSSPCNYEFVGGLRKVAKSPNHKQQTSQVLEHRSDEDTLSSVPYALAPQASFSSLDSISSETTNYKTYGDTPASASAKSLALSPSREFNHPLRQAPNPSLSFRFIDPPNKKESHSLSRVPTPSKSCSQSSLNLPSLGANPFVSSESLTHYKSQSKEFIRTGSLTSLSSTFSHRSSLRGIFGSGSFIHIPYRAFKSIQGQTSPSSWVEPLSLYAPQSHMNEHPHQWSSQLSTVLSVSEGGSDHASIAWSTNSRSSSSRARVMSIGSGYMSHDPLSPASRSLSWSGSVIDPPPSIFSHRARHNSNSSGRIVAEQDEHGDGITDLQNLPTRPLRRRTSGFYSTTSSETGRTNTMRSSASTRSSGLNLSLIPAWARLYYGSGESRLLCSSTNMNGALDSRTNSLQASSPSSQFFSSNIYSPRNRQHESDQLREVSLDMNSEQNYSNAGSDERSSRGSTKERTGKEWIKNGLWSPHLRPDRLLKRSHFWDPPSLDFASDESLFGRRKIQIVMFILGFLVPFFWMIASFLPLPHSPVVEMKENDRNSPTFDYYQAARKFNALEEARYESAVWWRKLNRWMSLVGIVIIAVVIVLVVVGIQQGWGTGKDDDS